MTDTEFMREALSLAQNGMGFVNPNPMVGAVIVRNGKIIGKGWHKHYGGLHAERNAFVNCDSRGINCSGADMYVTLEPCCHHGKTPPCTEAIIEHGISRVFIGSRDPNPLVSGQGAEILKNHGIEVIEGILREECDSLNEIFMHYIITKTPFVTMKYAMTMDGKIACYTGESKWITGEDARERVQHERLRHSAIMVGAGTVIADDPMLTCRIENGRNPIRIVCDSNLRVPLSSNIIQTAKDIPTIIATVSENKYKMQEYISYGCRIINTIPTDGKVNLRELMTILGKEGIDSILLEGGAELNWSALQSGVVSKVQTYIAPKLFGGVSAKSPIGGAGIPCPAGAFMLEDSNIVRIGEDILIESRLKNVYGNN